MKNDFDAERYAELSLLARCAHLYFLENMSQLEIAEALGLTRSKVSRYIKRIVDEGFVEISLNFPQLAEIAAKLCIEYALRDAIVVPTGERKYLRADIGQAAARYLERVVGDGARIGISCGLTLYEMVRQIREIPGKDIRIYPMAADASYESVDISPNTLVGMLVAKLRPKAIGVALPTQIVEKSVDVIKRRRELLKQTRIQEILQEARGVDVALIGVGAIEPGVPGFCMIAQEYGLKCADIVNTTKAVAEYNYALIDSEGKPVAEKPQMRRNKKFQEVTNRIISVSLKDLNKLAKDHGHLVVCVAGGGEKVSGIRSVMKGHLANVLITDLETAKSLLSGN